MIFQEKQKLKCYHYKEWYREDKLNESRFTKEWISKHDFIPAHIFQQVELTDP